MSAQRVSSSWREDPAFPPRTLRDVLGSFPTGVAVVTAAGTAGEKYGITVSSFNSLSLNPPLVLFSLSRELLSLEGLLQAPSFAINFLRDDQADLCLRFATALSGKWQDVELRAGATGNPILATALAVLECQPYAQYDGGDHIIVVGRVTHLEVDSARHPLVFFRGQYHTLSSQEKSE